MTAIQLHATESSQKTAELIIAGATGRVGDALRKQIATLQDARIRLHPIIEANSRVTTAHIDGRHLQFDTDWRATLALLRREQRSDAIFVDCTASEDVAALYPELLREGFHIVTPNKIASAGPLLRYLEIRELARTRQRAFLHETTVGAALPLLRTIAELVATGDRVRSIQGVLSGTLSFILARLHEGARFSDAVGEAYARGLTEPDPTIDLSGGDVGRKLLILLREAGHAIYSSAVHVEPLLATPVPWHGSIAAFVEGLRQRDEAWRARAEEAASRGRRLVFEATFDGSGARAGISTAERDSPLAAARAGENVVIIHTDRYSAVPLTIAGPGAGPEVTAGGVLADVLRIANGGSH